MFKQNKRRSSITLIFLAWVILSAFSCSKSDSTSKKAVLQVNLKHHQVAHNLINCTVYIKYNTSDKPANEVYDDSAVAGNLSSDTMQTAIFSNLANGNYFLYGKGYDTSLSLPVIGGYPYTVSSQTTQSVDLAVSEN